MILFFDTETTGLPDYAMPPGHECQPHLVQIAALLTEPNGVERASICLTIRPPVFIPRASSDVHGITDEIADRCGVPYAVALPIWSHLARKAYLMVAHNIKFDMFVIESVFESAMPGRWAELGHDKKRQFCTAEAAASIVNLPPTERMIATGFGDKPKTPKLAECVRYFFGQDHIGAHDALADLRACVRVYFQIREMAGAPQTPP